MIIEKLGIMPKLWQINTIFDMIYNKKNVVILTNISFDKNLLYQSILFIKNRVIVIVV